MARRHTKVILTVALCLAAGTAEAVDIDSKLSERPVRGSTIFGADLQAVKAKYEGQRTDKTRAVHGSVRVRGQTETFLGAFERDGYTGQQFVVNFPAR